ncbi:MAG: 50S ribosomal protein L4 [Deltaproteobacteria bacterium]|nr:MAG: 50S ribosomal protein L4 [Deltaproteobacteria bacterium]PIE75287.1 MAG: 50S ribosomal protein L4 [Deltaproteobacteria bacterium]
MAAFEVLNQEGEKVSDVELSDDVFCVDVKPDILNTVVRMQLAARRAGTACAKGRSEIKGSTVKLYRQKGTGRARRGSIKSPLLRGGGVVFGPKPKSYAIKVPKKVRKTAKKMALSAKYHSSTLKILDKIELEEIKTKKFADILTALSVKNALIIVDEVDDKVILSARNIPSVKVLSVDGLNVYDVLKYENLILLESSARKIEGRLG